MAKRSNKQIEVEINETAKNTKDYTELELVVRKKVIGKIMQKSNGPVTVEFKSGKKRTARSVDEGIQLIIEEYNLHDE
ncbi:DUF2969 family protein [Alkalibacterium thalassium]|uniref:DUF2969 domain-containing protein n=1 Tax=Alkalibacterium thalassium TaxID=426701 RepID=A0A1G9G4B3_9LACT|nr:DUF2969 family protein [Alkalibacterium thalassium]SDK95133.1 Protein of unknown function [Alkalibacterium thalassium]